MYKVVRRPGSDPNKWSGIVKINLSTGKILRFDKGRTPGTAAVLATAGGLIFHGDINVNYIVDLTHCLVSYTILDRG